MRKIFVLFLTSALIISCSKNNQNGNAADSDKPTGFREFKIDENKSAIKVSLFGVIMGTPDYESVWAVIEDANNNGMIDDIIQFGTPIEGGVAHCIKVSDMNYRLQIIDELVLAPTSLKDSYYTVESVSDCSL